MRKLFLLLLTALIFTGCEIGKEKDDDHDVKEVENTTALKSIDLMTNDDPNVFAKTVILFDNDKYLVKTNLDLFISTYPFDSMYGYDKINEQVITDSKNQNSLIMSKYTYFPGDSTFILAHHLEKGTCLIYDKLNKKIVPSIKMCTWEDSPVPLGGAGGRIFYIKRELFLQTCDWIS